MRAQKTGAPIDRGLLIPDQVTGSTIDQSGHSWTIEANTGDYLAIEVDQIGVDLVVVVLDPSGNVARSIDAEAEGLEKVRWIAWTGGKWSINVLPFEKAEPGEYAVSLVDKRAAVEYDRDQVRADSLHSLALGQWNEGETTEAEDLFRRVLAIREQGNLKDLSGAADAANNLAALLLGQGRYQEAEPFFTQSLELSERTLPANDPRIAVSLNSLGYLFKLQGRYDDALEKYERALVIGEASLDPGDPAIASTLDNIATAYLNLGRHDLAEPLYLRALSILQASLGPEHPRTSVTMNNLAILFKQLGRYEEAEPLLKQSLKIRVETVGPDHPEVAATSYNIATFYHAQGRYEDAEPLYLRALEINERALGPEHPNVAIVLTGLAAMYVTQGRLGEAEMLLQRSLTILEKVLGPKHPSVATNLSDLGIVYSGQHRNAEAETILLRALAVTEDAFGPDHPAAVTIRANLAGVYLQQKRYEEALSLLQQVLSVSESNDGANHVGLTDNLWKIGFVHLALGQYDSAETSFEQSLAITEQSFGSENPQVALSLLHLAVLYNQTGAIEKAIGALDRAIPILDRSNGHPEARISAYSLRASLRVQNGLPDDAIEDLEEALLGAESMRPLVGGGEQTRASFFSQYGEAFNAMVDLQVRAGDVEAAFEYAERGRARVMLDQLQAGKIELRASIPEETRVGLEARERKAKTLLASYQQQITILGSRQDLSAQDRDTQLAVLEDSLRSADNTFSNVYADIKNASPLWRDLITSGGAPVTLRQVQRELVPRNGLMLLYQLGESSSFVFVIGEGRNDVTVLPLDISDEAAAVLGVEPGPLTTAALHLAMAGQDSSSVEGVLKSLASRGTRVSGRRRSSSTDQLHALWTILVPDSSWQQVVLAEEVVVVPDGPLFSLPFEALVVEAGADETTATYWLDDGPVIRYAPSATVLYNLERRPPSRLTPIASETLWLSLYDPIFDLEEIERVGAETSVQHPSESRSRDEFVRAGGSLARLPGTALEALALNTAFGKRVQSLQGLTATEAGLRAALGSKRFLHFATHGLVDETRGSLFASLALTPSNASVIDSENDGYLQLYEIYELPLDEIELAILSACETNLGDSIEGEGVFALSRGFLAAGSRRVVASQWAVDDASTADIMEGFFGLLSAQMARGENVNYGQDLRDAKRLIRSQPEWSSPYFWAPFILTGQR